MEWEAVLGVDTGGTFTDFALIRAGRIVVGKVPSTPAHPEQAVLTGLGELPLPSGVRIHYGTTVGTNAFLERRGSRVVLCTTAGFEDVLEIGRQHRPDLYRLCVQKPEPLVPRARRIGVRERIGPHGEVIQPLTDRELTRVVQRVLQKRPEAVAVVLLFSFQNPEHERRLGAALARAGVRVFLSAEVFPEYREYERTVVTTLNAYLSPIMERHLRRMTDQVPHPVFVCASSGGAVPVTDAIRRPVETLLSGPAAGVVGARFFARRSGFERVITLDMGGTSADVALIDGDIGMTTEARIGGLPLPIPLIDIQTVGAGGGSIAYRDPGGGLRVGPRSAGAVPGPICYGRGGREVTVTDAHLFLGRLQPEYFLGGRMRLHPEPAQRAVRQMAADFGLAPEEMAQGILDVANTSMERILRVVSVERGYDPSDFVLVAFGGAGGLHAAELAERLDIRRILVPPHAGTVSALGAALTRVTRNLTRSVLLPESRVSRDQLETVFGELEAAARQQVRAAGLDPAGAVAERFLYIRYRGQAYEISVPYTGDPAAAFRAFDDRHERYYGYRRTDWEREIVNVHLRLVLATPAPDLVPAPPARGPCRPLETRSLFYHDRAYAMDLYRREDLGAGFAFTGPALVFETTATTFVPPGWTGRVDTWGSLILEREG